MQLLLSRKKMNLKEDFSSRLQEVKEVISGVKKTYGNDDVTLVAVTKYSDILDLFIAYEHEQYDFGENKVQVLEEKAKEFAKLNRSQVKWHFIGNLQSNKVSRLLKIPNLFSIHSVTSKKLLEIILKKQNLFSGNRLDLFLEVNTSGESEKHGFSNMEEIVEAIELVKSYDQSRIKIVGLMTMGKIRTDNFEKDALFCFSKLRLIKEDIDKTCSLSLKLSMGMSRDYHIAVAEGADVVRVGSTLFK